MSAIRNVEVDSAVIEDIIDNRLSPALNGLRRDHGVLAMLTFSILLMKPDIDADALQAAVMGMSETAMLHIAEMPTETQN